MNRIVITGPESSGKTTLAKELAHLLGVPLVLEYARSYLEVNGPVYSFKDLEAIAEQQLANERSMFAEGHEHVVCDTDILTLIIWAQEKFDLIPDTWMSQYDSIGSESLYLLCSPDIPWEADPLRENPQDRWRLFHKYEQWLEGKRNHVMVGGRYTREKEALDIVRSAFPTLIIDR